MARQEAEKWRLTRVSLWLSGYPQHLPGIDLIGVLQERPVRLENFGVLVGITIVFPGDFRISSTTFSRPHLSLLCPLPHTSERITAGRAAAIPHAPAVMLR
jgi:hypothetical protein